MESRVAGRVSAFERFRIALSILNNIYLLDKTPKFYLSSRESISFIRFSSSSSLCFKTDSMTDSGGLVSDSVKIFKEKKQ